MKMIFNFLKIFISVLVFLFVWSVTAQEQAFYVRSLNSSRLLNDSLILQPIKFETSEVVYNKIAILNQEKIILTQNGRFQINGFVNINPGVVGKSVKDSINLAVYLIKNYTKVNEEVLAITRFSFTLGNQDVAHSFQFYVASVNLNEFDDLQIRIQYLPSSTLALNKSKKYNHVNKPTGLDQICGLRILKL